MAKIEGGAVALLFDELPQDRPARGRGRPRKLTPMDDAWIAEARHAGVPWKILTHLYGLARSRLAEAQMRGEAIISGH